MTSTLYRINKSRTDKCIACNITECVEHVLLYGLERESLKNAVIKAERSWDLEGLLGEGGGHDAMRRLLFSFLFHTALISRV